MEIRLHNACSIRDFTLSLEPGKIYIISGGNNSGKSSLFYSLSSALLNSKETKCYINNEALKEDKNATMEVELVDDNGSSYIYQRTPSSAKYFIDGKEYKKLGRGNLFDLIERQIPGLLYDPTADKKIVNIQGEENNLFPFNMSEGEQFKLFEKIFNISSTTDILRSMKLDEDDIDHKIEDNTRQITDNTTKKNVYTNLVNTIKSEDIQRYTDYFTTNLNILSNQYNDINLCNTLIISYNNTQQLKNKQQGLTITEQHRDIEKDFLKACKLAADIQATQDLKNTKRVFNVSDYNELNSDVLKVQSLEIDYNNYCKELLDLDVELQSIRKQLSTVEICPVCGKPLEGDDLCTQQNK